jgi:hypothetical protein
MADTQEPYRMDEVQLEEGGGQESRELGLENLGWQLFGLH